MTRQLRIKIPGGLYHIYSRGIDRSDIFKDNNDRDKFLEILQNSISNSGWRCYAYCLMNNHYHILIESADGDTSRGMHQLNSVYAQYFNWKHERVGPLFQGRFRSILVDRENYFLELCRYIVLNPVRAGAAKSPEEYYWSSYRVTSGLDNQETCIDREFVLSRFAGDNDSDASARAAYSQFVYEGLDKDFSPFEIKGDLILGDRKFVESLKEEIEKEKDNTDFPKFQRTAHRPDLVELLDPLTVSLRETRNAAVGEAYSIFGYTQKEIAGLLGINVSTVYRILKSI
ncbi:MAG: transposase [Candidatus Aegiribacteria sp.]|nr:transposase [Candidatus Aegiribacteria sp.]